MLAENCNLDYVILDDAYQNVDICKDVEILLVDARYPLINTYCLPAGFLREKDYSRADIIVLTHAKSLSKEQKNEWSDFFSTINPQHLFFGDNKWEGLFLCNQGDDKTQVVQRERVLLFAGIGNISGFVENVKYHGIDVVHVVNFGDHHTYTKEDILRLIDLCEQMDVKNMITTSKDWYKLLKVLQKIDLAVVIPLLYILRITFEFLSREQYDRFYVILDKSLTGEVG